MTTRPAPSTTDKLDENRRPTPAFWKRTVPSRAAAGWVAAAVLVSAAGIEIARAWTRGPEPGSDAVQVIGGFLVGVFVLSALVLATRTRDVALVAVVSIFGVLAHGGALVLHGDLIGAVFMGMAPVLALLTHATFRPADAAEPPPYRPTPVTFIRANVHNG